MILFCSKKTIVLAVLSCMSLLLCTSHAARADESSQKAPLTTAPVQPIFDLVVNAAPVSSVYAMLANASNYNVIVPSGLEGKVTMTLKGVNMLQALQALQHAYGYDFKLNGRQVTIASNAMTTRVFKLNYLTGNRAGSSQVRVQSGSLSGSVAASDSTSGATNQATDTNRGHNESSRVTMNSNEDFWRDVKATLVTLVSGEGRSMALNPGAGVLVVKASPREIELVDQYLNAVQLASQRQVMIEAKIVEVSLSDVAQSGINWSIFGSSNSGNTMTMGVVAPSSVLGKTGSIGTNDVSVGGAAAAAGWSLAAKALGTGFYGLAFQGANFAAVLNFLQTQGGVQVISSPRIATLNNQKALLKVGNDEFFVTNVTTSTTTSGNSAVTSPSITLTPFFSGISLDVTPQIDDDGVVTMHVHPAISDVKEKQKLVDLGSLGQFQIPSASSSVNETDSMVRIRTGQIAAIGGLMSQSGSSSKSGLPGAQDAPIVGSLFGQKSSQSSKREIVILIKPTVIEEQLNENALELLKNAEELLPANAQKDVGKYGGH